MIGDAPAAKRSLSTLETFLGTSAVTRLSPTRPGTRPRAAAEPTPSTAATSNPANELSTICLVAMAVSEAPSALQVPASAGSVESIRMSAAALYARLLVNRTKSVSDNAALMFVFACSPSLERLAGIRYLTATPLPPRPVPSETRKLEQLMLPRAIMFASEGRLLPLLGILDTIVREGRPPPRIITALVSALLLKSRPMPFNIHVSVLTIIDTLLKRVDVLGPEEAPALLVIAASAVSPSRAGENDGACGIFVHSGGPALAESIMASIAYLGRRRMLNGEYGPLFVDVLDDVQRSWLARALVHEGLEEVEGVCPLLSRLGG